jgi:hypothetical protein
MAAEFILEFEGVTTKEYDAVNKTLGIDPQSGEGDGPDGLVALSPQRSPLPGPPSAPAATTTTLGPRVRPRAST